MRVLLDTCVLTEIRHPKGNPQVRAFVESLEPESTFISVITLGELTNGVALLESGPRRDALVFWHLALEQRFEANILPIDAETARIWGNLSASARRQGNVIPASGGLTAATGRRFDLEVVTRNTRVFQATGARVIDPWAHR
ncbi:MAG: type II toxin-antitoxin system VapC family toxin [Thermomicrobiales bacterium]